MMMVIHRRWLQEKGINHGFSWPRGKNCKMRPLVSLIEASRKHGSLGNLNLWALLEPYRLLLFGYSLNTSKAINKIALRPWGKHSHLPLPLGDPVENYQSWRAVDIIFRANQKGLTVKLG